MIRKRNEMLDAVVAEIEAAGLGVAVERSATNHLKVTIIYGERKARMTLASTASDWRAQKNMVALARRIIRSLKHGSL